MSTTYGLSSLKFAWFENLFWLIRLVLVATTDILNPCPSTFSKTTARAILLIYAYLCTSCTETIIAVGLFLRLQAGCSHRYLNTIFLQTLHFSLSLLRFVLVGSATNKHFLDEVPAYDLVYGTLLDNSTPYWQCRAENPERRRLLYSTATLPGPLENIVAAWSDIARVSRDVISPFTVTKASCSTTIILIL